MKGGEIMARPRKTTTTSTGKIGKEKIKERQEQENKIKLDNKNLKAPAYLSETAKLTLTCLYLPYTATLIHSIWKLQQKSKKLRSHTGMSPKIIKYLHL